PVYLLIDPLRATVTLYTAPEDGGYRKSETAAFGRPLAVPDPFGFDLDTARLLARSPRRAAAAGERGRQGPGGESARDVDGVAGAPRLQGAGQSRGQGRVHPLQGGLRFQERGAVQLLGLDRRRGAGGHAPAVEPERAEPLGAPAARGSPLA